VGSCASLISAAMSEATTPLAEPPPGADSAGPTPPFEFTEDRRFELYMQQRQVHKDGAREAYQRFDQTIVALSGGSIVLSITFLKDIGHVPDSLPWLMWSWGFFLLASLSAFLSLLTSAETDRESVTQLDCQVETGACDNTKCERWSTATKTLNVSALVCCIVGVGFMIKFATTNILAVGETAWQSREKGVAQHQGLVKPPGTSELQRPVPPSPAPGTASQKGSPAKPSLETASPEGSPQKPIPVTQSHRP